MTDEEKQMMVLEEEYASLMSEARQIYAEYTYQVGVLPNYVDNISNMSECVKRLSPIKKRMKELEDQLGDRVLKYHGENEDWWSN